MENARDLGPHPLRFRFRGLDQTVNEAKLLPDPILGPNHATVSLSSLVAVLGPPEPLAPWSSIVIVNTSSPV